MAETRKERRGWGSIYIMTHYTIKQLSAAVGITEAQIRRHIKNGYLKAEKIPGAKGYRVTARIARDWASKHFTVQLDG